MTANLEKSFLRTKKENQCSKPRKVKSLCIESGKDFSLSHKSISISTRSRPSLITTTVTKPYTNVETENSVSILSKTETYFQERKRRSKSQPPEKRGKNKFEFLFTSINAVGKKWRDQDIGIIENTWKVT